MYEYVVKFLIYNLAHYMSDMLSVSEYENKLILQLALSYQTADTLSFKYYNSYMLIVIEKSAISCQQINNV